MPGDGENWGLTDVGNAHGRFGWLEYQPPESQSGLLATLSFPMILYLMIL